MRVHLESLSTHCNINEIDAWKIVIGVARFSDSYNEAET